MNLPLTATDPYLTLPLHGVRLIEASAGTGKTFTLATLVTRLVIERDLRVGKILVVTFTEAATQELRKRIRERLEHAAAIVATEATQEEAPDTALTRQIIDSHLTASNETPAQLQRRLQRAVLEVDLAAIFTIHGFCARVLREHALESDQPFAAPQLLTSDADLRDALASDLWRAFAANGDDAVLLPTLWHAPEELARDLPSLMSAVPLLPVAEGAADDGGAARADVDACFQALKRAFVEHGDDARRKLEDAIAQELLNKSSYKPEHVAPLWSAMEQQLHHGGPFDDYHDKLPNLRQATLSDRTKVKLRTHCPQSPLFLAVGDYLDARARHRQAHDRQRVALLHRVRDDARRRLRQTKQTLRLQTYDDLIDDVADALDSDHGEVLAQRLRQQYEVALVDEFQDTDARQWGIFERVFGAGRASADDPGSLFLIGDPKQAIYGFRGGDVHTYLAAAALAERAPPLDRNFRSRPGVLRAIESLYANAGERPFVVPGIDFHPVRPGERRSDDDFIIDGVAAPALTVRMIAPDANGEAHNVERSRELATDACVAAIHDVLSRGREGRATIDGKPVQPADIAVLVRRHNDATRIQRALTAVGIPAVAAGKQSLFSTDEAAELRMLFEALLQPADDGRLRTALATVLLGVDAHEIDALESDGAAYRRRQLEAMAWRERWQRSGPFALVSDLCATHAERLLGLLDGERRLTNYLQLGELMQDADARSLGLHGLVDWLCRRIAEADSEDEAQLLRLESDAQCVQIVTLHKSKGLEYPLVYLPFAAIGGQAPSPDRYCIVHDGDRRQLRWRIDKDDPDWRSAAAEWRNEQFAEDARLLYVGLTRARDALWLASGGLYAADKTRLAPMLDAQALRAHPDVSITIGEVIAPTAPLNAPQIMAVAHARVSRRAIPRDWWVYSFTQLAQAEAGAEVVVAVDERGAIDEPAEAEPRLDDGDAFDPRFSGSRFGNVLHDALEHTDFLAWNRWSDGAGAPAGQQDILAAALRNGGYAEDDVVDGLPTLERLVGRTLTAALPEGGRLCDLDTSARRAEIEFHFALQPTSVDALIDVLHRFGVVAARRGFGTRRRLEGLMTGKIDLTYTVDGRWYVLDYKSNRLPAYDATALDAAMAHSEYDLQALIYTLALHRWLRFRLGDAYDYGRDFGGVRYLFCRGLVEGQGIHAHTPDVALVDALDALFAGGAA
ncbi:MAG TPA: exodeoxyribonuclease V subunit beta [Lysobacter sp.]